MRDPADLKDVRLVPVSEPWWKRLVRRLLRRPAPLEFVEREPPRE